MRVIVSGVRWAVNLVRRPPALTPTQRLFDRMLSEVGKHDREQIVELTQLLRVVCDERVIRFGVMLEFAADVRDYGDFGWAEAIRRAVDAVESFAGPAVSKIPCRDFPIESKLRQRLVLREMQELCEAVDAESTGTLDSPNPNLDPYRPK